MNLFIYSATVKKIFQNFTKNTFKNVDSNLIIYILNLWRGKTSKT